MNVKLFQKRLKALRKERGWTIKETDLMSALSGCTIHFEEGLSTPDNYHLFRYAKAFNVAIEYLKGEVDDKNYRPPKILSSIPTEDLINELKRRVMYC